MFLSGIASFMNTTGIAKMFTPDPSIADQWFCVGGINWGALIMIGVSVSLTLISGLIPAGAAAKKDPVIALRTE